jgi:hypothetical protein
LFYNRIVDCKSTGSSLLGCAGLMPNILSGTYSLEKALEKGLSLCSTGKYYVSAKLTVEINAPVL